MLPVNTDATPDERPLERAELDIIARHIPGIRMRHFSAFDRLNRFVLHDRYDYENSSRARRFVSNVLSVIDYGVLSVPAFQFLAGTSVIHGHKAR